MSLPFPFSREIFPTLVALGGLALVACDHGARDDSDSDEAAAPTEAERQRVTETGQAASDALMKSLGGQLKGALQSGGPVQAITVCQQAALPLTAAAGESFEGVSIRRTTLKPRNPANAPDDLDTRVLETMAAAAKQSKGPPEPVVEWGEDVARFYRPLMIQEVCLNCHGDPASFSPELTQALAERYPDDQGTGYALGDFRGVIRVDIARAQP